MFKCLIFNVSHNHFSRTMGSYRIAHVLREEGWDCEVIQYTNYWTLDELQELVKSRVTSDTIFVGFSQMFNARLTPTVKQFVKWLKEYYPDIVLVHGTGSSPNEDAGIFDLHIKGFGEVAIIEFLKWRTGNGSRPRFEVFGSSNVRYKIIDANKNYPAFPTKSLMIKYEDRDFLQPDEWLGIEFARGCKFKCDFCNFPVLGVKGDYSRDAEDFRIQMMDTYDRFGISNYMVADETFNDRTEKITKFADIVESLPFTTWFSGFIRADLLVTRPMDRVELSRMNFLGHHYGIETFNKQAGKAIKKGMDPDKMKQGLIDIKDYFKGNGRKLYRGFMTLIVGLPGETVESINETKNWLLDHWQGESFLPFALEIPIGKLDNNSLISKNYQDYGYRKMVTDRKIRDRFNIKLSDNLLVWENDQMNVFTAIDMAEELWKTYHSSDNNFTIDCWTLGHTDMIGSIDDRLKESITKRISLIQPDVMSEKTKAIIENYKHKKLSL